MKKLGKTLIIFTLLFCASLGLFKTSADASSNETIIYNTLRNTYGFNRAQAAGILANIYAESSFNPNIYNKSKISYGLMQWTGSRKTALFNYCNSRGLNSASISAQLSFMYYEFTTSEKRSYNAIKSHGDSSNGAYNAAYDMCIKYERPAAGVNAAIKRGNLARNTFYGKYANTTVVTTTNNAPVTIVNSNYKTTGRLNVRKGPSTSYGTLGTLAKGASVNVTTTTNGFGRISYNGKVGYVSLKYLSGVSNVATTTNTSTTSSNTRYTVTSNLNIRAGMSTSSKRLGRYTKGTKINVSSISNGWARVSYNGKTAYVSASYIRKG